MIYEGITRADYDKLEGINHSKLKHFKNSIKHGHYRLSEKIAQTPAMRLGTAIHTLVLEPHKYQSEYCIGGPINPKTETTYGSGTKKFAEWMEEQGEDKIFLSNQDAEKANAISQAVKRNEDAARVLRQSNLKECAMTWVDEETGFKCKCLIDFASTDGRFIGDLKSISGNLTYDSLSSTLYKMDYHQQFSFYNAGAIANGLRPQKFLVIFCQTTDEKDVVIAEIGEQSLHYGEMQYRKCLNNYRECINGNIKGYHSNQFVLDVPYWAMSEFMDLEESGILFEETV